MEWVSDLSKRVAGLVPEASVVVDDAGGGFRVLYVVWGVGDSALRCEVGGVESDGVGGFVLVREVDGAGLVSRADGEQLGWGPVVCGAAGVDWWDGVPVWSLAVGDLCADLVWGLARQVREVAAGVRTWEL